MNKKRLMEDCRAEIVAEYLNIEMQQRGKFTFIICPGHEKRLGRKDNKMGNAVLRDRGYYCYACNCFVNTHDMVMEVTGCDSEEAYRIMAAAMGGEGLYEDVPSTDNAFIPKFRLTQKECEIIGLYPRLLVEIDTENGKVQDGLFALYKQNKKAYYGMIIKSAKSSLDKYQQCLSEFADAASSSAYKVYDLLEDKFDHSIYKLLQKELMERIAVCKKIICIFSKAKEA